MRALPLLLALTLAACTAEEVEITLSAADVARAAQGAPVTVAFEAELGEDNVTFDDDKRAMIDGLVRAVETHFPGAAVDLRIGPDDYRITVEGTLPLAPAAPAAAAPWFLQVSPAALDGALRVELATTPGFAAFDAALRDLNAIMGPDAFQPVTFRLSGPGARVIAAGAWVDGRPVTAEVIALTDRPIRLLYEDGIWEDTGAGFLILP
ncbi:MAG TPA: hypothetical protein VLA78_02795 [Paracoccaceae bacterium]|nr:hypothetical protein [Paracoccaceae bacterium]